MKKPTRKSAARLPRDERMVDILNAARNVFCEKGYEATTVAEVAQRIGVAEPTVFKYFDTKRDLLHRVLEHWYEQMFGDYARDLAGINDPRQRLRLLVWRHLRSIKENPSLCRLMFREVRAEHDYEGTELHALNKRYTDFLVEAIKEGVHENEFRADVPVILLRDMVYGAIEHHVWSYLRGRGELDVDKVADQIVDVLCDGIAVQQSADYLRVEAERLSKIVDRIEHKLTGRKAEA